MRNITLFLVAGLAALAGSSSWADPGKNESGHGDFDRFSRYEAYRETDREALKHYQERRREAAKARREHEREAAKAWAEMAREERKHYQEMQREAQKHREEMRREAWKHREELRRETREHRGDYWHDDYWLDGVVETIVYHSHYD